MARRATKTIEMPTASEVTVAEGAASIAVEFIKEFHEIFDRVSDPQERKRQYAEAMQRIVQRRQGRPG